MTLDAYFDNTAIYSLADKIDVTVGQEFSLVMNDYAGEDIFSNNDLVLDIIHNDDVAGALITTKTVGESRLLIMNGDTITARLSVRVVDAITPPAVTLDLKSGAPEPKSTSSKKKS